MYGSTHTNQWSTEMCFVPLKYTDNHQIQDGDEESHMMNHSPSQEAFK